MMLSIYRVAAVDLAEETSLLHQLRDISYSEQYDILFNGELDAKKVSWNFILRFNSNAKACVSAGGGFIAFNQFPFDCHTVSQNN